MKGAFLLKGQGGFFLQQTIHGNIAGLNKATISQIETLYSFTMDKIEFASLTLLELSLIHIFRAVNLDVGPFGSEFDLQIRGADSVHCTTQLLGKHNIMNVLGCAAAAYELGLTLEQIAAGIQKAEPVEHRLQLINPNNGTLVIDDAFNSNPNGTKAAMEVLSMYCLLYTSRCV